MKIVWNELLKYAVVGNLLHLFFSLIYSFIRDGSSRLSIGFTVLMLLMYTIIGFVYSTRGESKRESHFLTLGLITTLPMIIFLVLSQILDSLEGLSAIQDYILFYIIGAPTIFWHRPFEPIMNFFSNSSIYIQLDINVAVVIFFLFIGGYIGLIWSKVKKSKAGRIVNKK